MADLMPVTVGELQDGRGAAADPPSAPADVPDAKPDASGLSPVTYDMLKDQPTSSAGGYGDYVKGLVRSAAQGATFNWGDEIEALARKGMYGGNYQSIVNQIRNEMDNFRTQYPKASLAAEVAGGLAVPGLGATAAVGRLAGAGAGLAARAAVGGGVGALEGGLGAIGASEGKPGDAANIGIGTGLGAALGGALPVVGGVLRPLAEGIGSRVPYARGVVSDNQAMRAVGDAFDNSAARQSAREGQTITRDDVINNVRGQVNAPPDPVTGAIDAERSLATTLDYGSGLANAVRNDSAAGAGMLDRRIAETDRIRRDQAQASYDALHQMPNVSSPQLQQLTQGANANPLIAGADATARDWLRARNIAPSNAPGTYSPAHLDVMDQVLQSLVQNGERSGARDFNAGVARDTFQGALQGGNADAQNFIGALRDAQRQYGVASNMLRQTPQAAADAGLNAQRASSIVDDITKLGAGAVMGYHSTFIGKALAMLGADNQPARAEAILRHLTTRYGDAGQMTQMLDRLQGIPASRREAILNNLFQMSTAAGTGTQAATANSTR